MNTQTINRLALNRGYLCGAMDRATDGGIGWRQDLIESLKDLNILWLDPTRKLIDIGVEDLENRDEVKPGAIRESPFGERHATHSQRQVAWPQ